MRARNAVGTLVVALTTLLLAVGSAATPYTFSLSKSTGQQATPPPPEKSQQADKKEEGDKKEEEKKKDKEKTFEEIVKDTEKVEGLFTFYRKPDEDKVFLEIQPDQFDQDFIYSAKLEQGAGERGLWGTSMMGQFVFQWHRQGKQVQFVQKNTRFTAQPGSPTARALRNSFTDSLVASAKTLSKPHPERNSVLIDLNEIFLANDLHNLGSALKSIYGPGYKLDKNNSAFDLIKSFPRNAEIGTKIHFQAAGDIKNASTAVPDPRSLTVRYRYSLVALPENDYIPRVGDDRVGYFMDMYMDFTSDKPETPYVRYINRWKLVKKNPNAALSEPVEPIVFWLENTIPEEYRPWIREGVLMWNAAFEKAGFKNAVVVKQMPDDAEWDPSDIRYNTLRWFVGYGASFARGPNHSNPYTGQILDADIQLSEGIFRQGARRRYQYYVDPVQRLREIAEEPPLPAPGSSSDLRQLCAYTQDMADFVSIAYDTLLSRPDWNPEKEKEFMRQYTAEVVAHEVGHTLGLRHNFRASTINTLSQLADTKRSHSVGLAASVMDYNPPIVALKGEKQGDYLPRVVGSYDTWAIEYGYKPIPGAKTPEGELPALRKIAARAADPLLPYATDEDAGLNARALDPRNTRFDFAEDPLAWYAHEFKLIRELWANMESKLLQEGDSYDVLRRSFGYTWNPYAVGSLVAAKYIGGIHHNRDHFGDPNGRLPYEPLAAARQREALEFLAREIWAPDVFRVPADLLNKLQITRFRDFPGTVFRAQRLDYPLLATAASVQAIAFGSLYHPLRLARLQDLELKYPDPNDSFTLADLFIGVREAIWAELDGGSNINSFRRNLQRAHLDRLTGLLLKTPDGTPHDAITLARADLVTLKNKIEKALAGGSLDYLTRAHLEETTARINAALEAQIERTL